MDAFTFEVTAAFVASVYAAVSLTRYGNFVCVIWPANGLLLGGLLLAKTDSTRRALLVLCFLGNVAANLAAGEPATAALGFSIVNAIEVSIAYACLRRMAFGLTTFTTVEKFSRFAYVCGAIAPAIAATFGALVVGAVYGGAFLSAYKTWFLADSLGLLIVTPAIVLMEGEADISREPPQKDLLLHFLVLFAASFFVFCQNSAPLLFLLLPMTIVIAFKFGPKYASLAILSLAGIGLFATFNGLGPLALIPPDQPALRVFVIQLFCLVAYFTCILVAAEVTQRNDLSRRLEATSRLAEEKGAQLYAAFDNMSQGVCLFDQERRVVTWNQRFLKIYALDPSLIKPGLSFSDLCAVSSAAGVLPDSLQDTFDLGQQGCFDQRLKGDAMIRIVQKQLEDGRMICTYSDITAERIAAAALLHQSLHDALTGLPNRRLLMDRIEQALAHASRSGGSCAVMILDLDHFKDINDTHGHAAGDELLQVVARRLQSCVRAVDTVARLGGDEFAIVLCDDNESPAHDLVAQRILACMTSPIAVVGASLSIGISIGIAMGINGAARDALLKAADNALYDSKRRGRNTFSFCVPDECPTFKAA